MSAAPSLTVNQDQEYLHVGTLEGLAKQHKQVPSAARHTVQSQEQTLGQGFQGQ